jgi:hypothetical protein
MQVINKRVVKTTPVGELRPSDCFKFPNDLKEAVCIKVDQGEPCILNGDPDMFEDHYSFYIIPTTGKLYKLDNHVQVVPLEIELHIVS